MSSFHTKVHRLPRLFLDVTNSLVNPINSDTMRISELDFRHNR